MSEHVETSELKKQLEAAGAPHVRGIGEILLHLGQQNEQIAELIEQDLANREMSIEACGKTLYDYAKKHQKGGSWACAVFGMNSDNPVIKLILDFYKILIGQAPADRHHLCREHLRAFALRQ